ncbi:MAG: ceramidase domain-containing protein [Hyphomicrobium sp.]|nr:ceramidase domain-containing protein [Hyphomicrobium sp.]
MTDMGGWEKVFAYCERGTSALFWAEPFNALSNGAFFVSAIFATSLLASQVGSSRRVVEWTLVALLFLIGFGSFLFHTYATRWASVADTAPIGVFMLAYLGYAVRRFLGASWVLTLVSLVTFVAAMRAVELMPCSGNLMPFTAAAERPCLNGSRAYLPALAALLIVGAVLLWRRHGASWFVLGAGVVFAVSLGFRTVDFEFCASTELFGRVRGTHAVWHVLNALVLYLLLRAAIIFGGGVDEGDFATRSGRATGIIRWS